MLIERKTMTQDEIIDKLLFQAGANFGGDGINYEEFDFRKFAKLIERHILSMDNPHLRIALDAAQDKARKDEREACARVCDEFNFGQTPMMIQRAIRARGEQA